MHFYENEKNEKMRTSGNTSMYYFSRLFDLSAHIDIIFFRRVVINGKSHEDNDKYSLL